MAAPKRQPEDHHRTVVVSTPPPPPEAAGVTAGLPHWCLVPTAPDGRVKCLCPVGHDHVERDGFTSARAMNVPGQGQVFADTVEDARIAHLEHGAEPAFPDQWPWPDWLGEPEPEVRPSCVDMCWPDGMPEGWVSATCIHGTHQRDR